jgi:hypothetical protein
MPLSLQAIQEFKQIYKVKFNIDLTDEEATEKAENLMNLFRIIYKNSPDNNESSKISQLEG